MPSPTQLLIVLLVLVLLFGASKLPTLARSAGQSLRIFKSEMNELNKDGKGTSATTDISSEPTTAQDQNPDRTSQKATPVNDD
jgi:sec-independent protein translocase protein TatA